MAEVSDAAFYDCVSYRIGDLLVDLWVESVGDKLCLGGESSNGFGGCELHL